MTSGSARALGGMRAAQAATLGAVMALASWSMTVAAQPQTLEVGNQTLRLKSEATRTEMFGLVTLYDVALYAPATVSSLGGLQGRDTAKALHVDVQYDGSLPDKIPAEWRQELQPALNAEQTRQLRQAYANLGPKDEIRITYAPGAGTTLSVSGREVLSGAEYDVMAAFLDIWLGQTPVSEDVKEQLVSGL